MFDKSVAHDLDEDGDLHLISTRGNSVTYNGGGRKLQRGFGLGPQSIVNVSEKPRPPYALMTQVPAGPPLTSGVDSL